MGDGQNEDLRVRFDGRLKLKFLGSRVTTYAGLLAYRKLEEAFGLTETTAASLQDYRLGQNTHGQGITEDFVGDAQVLINIDSFKNIAKVSEY